MTDAERQTKINAYVRWMDAADAQQYLAKD